ncbi:MAG TPA: amidase [Saprospiraceae bacterium]|nr:amidase [Saprospiraceae bacterium]HMP14776.1 amidase [Saprospiraceae bacterium]
MIPKQIQTVLFIMAVFGCGAFTGRYWLYQQLNHADVRGAANVAGLEFTQTEMDSLLPGLEDFRKYYIANRNYVVTNDIAPALMFQPVLPGISVPPPEPDQLHFSHPGKVTLPDKRDELAFYTVRQLAELIRNQEITSLELTRFFLNRLKKYDPQLHCVISLTEELALAQARRADAEIKQGIYRGLLHGIPYGAKDLLAKQGYPTTWGATPYRNQSFEYDATVIQKLEAAGAVLVAKLTLGELAWGDVWFGGMTRNPWDISTGSSGSSAGSASAVAAGLIPFAIGSETLGSIVSPATVCGTTGLRPTFGRVSKYGAMALSWSMDKIGPIARSAEDCAIVFAAIHGPDGKDMSVIPAPFHYQANFDTKKLRIGYVKADFERPYPFKMQDSLTLVSLQQLGYQLIPIVLPELPAIRFILDAEAAAAFDDLTLSNQDTLLVRQIRNAWPNVFRQARFIPAVEYIKANRLRTKLMLDMQALFSNLDVYIHPSWGSNSLTITNLTGHPCVVMPNGFLPNSRPTSITFTGKLFGEAELLALAHQWQRATTHHHQHPILQ